MTERYTFASAKVLKPKSQEFMEHTLVRMLSNTLHETLFSEMIRGVSISPKKHFCIVKAWIVSDTNNRTRCGGKFSKNKTTLTFFHSLS